MQYDTPIIIDPTGGHKGYHPDGEEGVARAAKIGDHLMILSTQATTSVADVIAARGRPIWSQLYATNKFEVAKHHVESMERRARSPSRSPSTATAAATRRSRCACAGSTRGSARAVTTAPALPLRQRDKPMYEGAISPG